MCSIFYSAVLCAAHVVLLSLAFSLCTLSGDTVVCKCVGYAHTHRASTHTHFCCASLRDCVHAALPVCVRVIMCVYAFIICIFSIWI